MEKGARTCGHLYLLPTHTSLWALDARKEKLAKCPGLGRRGCPQPLHIWHPSEARLEARGPQERKTDFCWDTTPSQTAAGKQGVKESSH